jgi:myo-inositol-1(or 4)-monophosphatase
VSTKIQEDCEKRLATTPKIKTIRVYYNIRVTLGILTMHPMLNISVRAARNASKIILQSMGQLESVNITQKQRNDFVTEVDKASEREIINTIHKAYPNHAILAEESGLSKGGDEDYLWIVDPLDGTTNYIHGLPHFCISIAFQYRGRLEHGVIYDPVGQELFVASRGEGAQLNDRRIRVSQNHKLESALVATGFPFKAPQQFDSYLNTFHSILSQTSDLRRSGSAALDLAYVAAARLDGYWELSLSPWDIAAGILLVTEAGGMVSDFQGTENSLSNGTVVAGNPRIFKAMLENIQRSLQLPAQKIPV